MTLFSRQHDVPSVGRIPTRLMLSGLRSEWPTPNGTFGFAYATDQVKLAFDNGAWLGIGGAGVSGVFNIADYGAAVDGVTDDTAAVLATIQAASAVSPRGVVLFPRGITSVTGGFDLSGLNGISIIGMGEGSSIIRLAHATNNLFFWSSADLIDLTMGNFSVTSDTVARTAGWVLQGSTTYNSGVGFLRRSRIYNIDVKKQVNGFGFTKYTQVWCSDVEMSDFVGSGGIGCQMGQTTASNINQGAELYLRNVSIFGNDFVGADPDALSEAFHIEDTDAVYMLNCVGGSALANNLNIVASAAGHHPTAHFFTQCVFDATKTSHSAWLHGQNIGDVRFTGCWFASAGQIAGGSAGLSGLRIEPTVLSARISITGGVILNPTGACLYLAASGVVAIDGMTISAVANQDAIFVDTLALNNLGPVICGCYLTASGTGFAVHTSVNSNRMNVVGCATIGGTSFGVACTTAGNFV